MDSQRQVNLLHTHRLDLPHQRMDVSIKHLKHPNKERRPLFQLMILKESVLHVPYNSQTRTLQLGLSTERCYKISHYNVSRTGPILWKLLDYANKKIVSESLKMRNSKEDALMPKKKDSDKNNVLSNLREPRNSNMIVKTWLLLSNLRCLCVISLKNKKHNKSLEKGSKRLKRKYKPTGRMLRKTRCKTMMLRLDLS